MQISEEKKKIESQLQTDTCTTEDWKVIIYAYYYYSIIKVIIKLLLSYYYSINDFFLPYDEHYDEHELIYTFNIL